MSFLTNVIFYKWCVTKVAHCNHVRSIFSILIELGIPNLVCGCILGCSVMYQFCNLDLISRIIVSGAYLVYYLREESQICCMDTSLDADVSHTIFRSL